jgi:hypothetical protein
MSDFLHSTGHVLRWGAASGKEENGGEEGEMVKFHGHAPLHMGWDSAVMYAEFSLYMFIFSKIMKKDFPFLFFCAIM